MSLLVCLQGSDGLVFATDSRGTVGDPRGVTAQNDRVKKLYLANDRVGILVAGAGDLGSTVVASFLELPRISSLDVTQLTMALHHHVRGLFRSWFKLFAIRPIGNDTRPARPDLNFLVAGFGSNQVPRIFRMSSSLDFAPMLHNYGFGIEGVAQYGIYLLNRLYDPEATVAGLQQLAAYVITETASQDGKVGGAVQIAAISEGQSQLLDVATVDCILSANRSRSLILRASFTMRKPGSNQESRPLPILLHQANVRATRQTNTATPHNVDGEAKTHGAESTIPDQTRSGPYTHSEW